MDKELMDIIKTFSKLFKENESYDSEEVKNIIKQLYNYLNTKFPCDLDAFSNFADMYRQAEFKHNIDIISCEGTAEFIANSIENFCYN